jgi:hypothetical protein
LMFTSCIDRYWPRIAPMNANEIDKPFHNVILNKAKNLGLNLDRSAKGIDRDVSRSLS